MKRNIISVAILSAIVMFSCCFFKGGDIYSLPRMADLAIDESGTSDFADSIKTERTSSYFRAVGVKAISASDLAEFETVSETNADFYDVEYEVVASNEDGTIALNVFFEDSGESIIENFTGYPATNYNGEKDILFIVDDMHIFLSELEQLSDVDKCSWFGNILHKVLNAGMIALSVIEPAIQILARNVDNFWVQLYFLIKDTTYRANYLINSSKTQPSNYVNRQSDYSDWKFGYSYLNDTGCEVIAGYNLARAKGKTISLAETVFLYEGLGIEIGLAQGFFGSNPYQIWYFLKSMNISYDVVFNYNAFESKMNNSTNYYVILARWNGESRGDMVHTFMVDKNVRNSKKYTAYNRYSDIGTIKTNSIDDLFGNNVNKDKTFMCAYFVSR